MGRAGWQERFRLVRALVSVFCPLPVGYVQGVELQGSHPLFAGPGPVPAGFLPERSAVGKLQDEDGRLAEADFPPVNAQEVELVVALEVGFDGLAVVAQEAGKP